MFDYVPFPSTFSLPCVSPFITGLVLNLLVYQE